MFLIPDYRSLTPEGAIAQLGERLLCKQEVVGSIPSGSTRRLDAAAPSRQARRRKLVREKKSIRASRHVARRQTGAEARVLSDIVKRRSIQALRVTEVASMRAISIGDRKAAISNRKSSDD